MFPSYVLVCLGRRVAGLLKLPFQNSASVGSSELHQIKLFFFFFKLSACLEKANDFCDLVVFNRKLFCLLFL